MNSNKKVVVVSGGTSGIGLAIVKKYIKNGWLVHVIGRNNNLIKDIKSKDLFFHNVNLENIDNLKLKCEKILEISPGGPDIIVNCAGVFQLKSIENIKLEDYNNIFNVNVRAPIFTIKYFIDVMKNKKSSIIFNIGSSSCYSGGKLTSLYCSSKHALLGFSRSISDEFKDFGVRVCNLSPSSTKTKMGKLPLASNQKYETFIDPEEVAKTLYFISKFEGNMEIKEILLNRTNVQ
tara:strand:- start:316 stop:1017 length:702 start_codon:yes stop_codon:yes gene_type:complete